MKITRRGFVKGMSAAAGIAALSPNLVACGGEEELGPRYVSSVFVHGVASGDPLTDAVIIWTRVTTAEELAAGGTPVGPIDGGEVEVEWMVATDAKFTNIVAGDVVTTDVSRDYTVKIDVQGLEPGTTYYYQFAALDEVSQIGRTRTAPAGDVQNLRFVSASCASLAHGYFTAYRAISKRNDIDAVLFLGDYIYEYASNAYGRARPYDPPHEIVTLQDYRRRHAQYKADIDLQDAHQQHPFICVWDDHEVADNTWKDGANNHQPDTEGDYETRRNGAHQAYAEWMPIRDQEDRSKIYRSFKYGDLVDLIMLDTRSWGRDLQGEEQSEERSMLGADQEAWLHDQLQAATGKWKFLGQQVMVAPLSLNGGTSAFNSDQWDGYTHARTRLLGEIENTPGGNVIVLTGDIHTAWANDISHNPFDPAVYNPTTGKGSVAVEFVCTSITSPGLEGIGTPSMVKYIKDASPHMKHINLSNKGFTVLDITPDRVQADFMIVDTIKMPVDPVITVDASFFVKSGAPFLVAAPGALGKRSKQPALAPLR